MTDPQPFKNTDEYPSTSPPDKPRIIDVDIFDSETHEVSLWDAIVTVLYNISKDVLSDFLNCKDGKFRLWGNPISENGELRAWFISRSPDEVSVGTLLNPKGTNSPVPPFDRTIHLKIDSLGAWKLSGLTASRWTEQPESTVLKSEDYRFESYEGDELRVQSSDLQKQLLRNEIWDTSQFSHIISELQEAPSHTPECSES